MKLSEVRKLHPGDEVYWNDPDGGTCSRMLKIRHIKIHGGGRDAIVIIEDVSGDVVECFAGELS